MWRWGVTVQGFQCPLPDRERGCGPCGHRDQARSGHTRMLQRSRVQEGSATAAAQRVVWGGGRGQPGLPGPAVSVARPRGAVGGSVSRWDRRRGAIAAWHAD